MFHYEFFMLLTPYKLANKPLEKADCVCVSLWWHTKKNLQQKTFFWQDTCAYKVPHFLFCWLNRKKRGAFLHENGSFKPFSDWWSFNQRVWWSKGHSENARKGCVICTTRAPLPLMIEELKRALPASYNCRSKAAQLWGSLKSENHGLCQIKMSHEKTTVNVSQVFQEASKRWRHWYMKSLGSCCTCQAHSPTCDKIIQFSSDAKSAWNINSLKLAFIGVWKKALSFDQRHK